MVFMTCRASNLEHVILRLMVHLVDGLLATSWPASRFFLFEHPQTYLVNIRFYPMNNKSIVVKHLLYIVEIGPR